MQKKINKLRSNDYFQHMGLIVFFAVSGYMNTILTDVNIKEVLSIIGILGIVAIFSSVISVVENQKKPKMLTLIMDLLLIIVVFAYFYSLIYSLNSNAFQISTDGVVYLDLLYFSFVTFTTLGYGDILPITYLAKFTAAIEAFMFSCVIAFVVLNFSGSIKKYLAVYKESDETDNIRE